MKNWLIMAAATAAGPPISTPAASNHEQRDHCCPAAVAQTQALLQASCMHRSLQAEGKCTVQELMAWVSWAVGPELNLGVGVARADFSNG